MAQALLEDVAVGRPVPEGLLRRLPGAGRLRVLYFMRSASCPVCRQHLSGLSRNMVRLESLGTSVVAFVPEAGASTIELSPGQPLPFPVVSGEEAYGQLGLRRVLLGAFQQSGTVVIDASGVVRLLRRATMPFSAFDERELFDVLAASARAGRPAAARAS